MKRLAMILAALALLGLVGTAHAGLIVIDNGDTGYSELGVPWANGAESSYPSSIHEFNDDRAYSNTTTDTATWSFTGLDNGPYLVYAHWVEQSNRTTVADYTVSDGGGIYRVNQQLAQTFDLQIRDVNSELHWFQEFCLVNITDGTIDVTLSFADENDGKFAIADAVAVNRIPEPTTGLLLALGVYVLTMLGGRRRR